jgi:hypothetical protein
MRFRDLLESAGVSGPFYHVTTDSRLKSIMTTGLEPGHHRRWKNAFGAKLGERGYLYLISNFTASVKWAAKQDYEYRTEGKKTKTVILVLHNIPTASVDRDPNIEGQLRGHSWFRSTATVAPTDIVRVIPLTAELVQQVVKSGTVAPPELEQPEPEQPPA